MREEGNKHRKDGGGEGVELLFAPYKTQDRNFTVAYSWPEILNYSLDIKPQNVNDYIATFMFHYMRITLNFLCDR